MMSLLSERVLYFFDSFLLIYCGPKLIHAMILNKLSVRDSNKQIKLLISRADLDIKIDVWREF